LYVAGPVANVNGGGVNNHGWATNFIYYGLPSNSGVNFQANGDFTGAIYAPNAVLGMNGGGTTVQDFVGACVVRSVNVVGHYQFHYDEALGKFGPPSIYVITSWIEL